MKLVTMNELFAQAQKEKYAIAAVNCCDLESIRPILKGAEQKRSPVIVQAAPVEVNYASARGIVDMVKFLGRDIDIPVAIHLDHGDSYEVVAQCVQGGFTSVMFDGSSLTFEENIVETRRVAQLAHAAGLSCEGELGTIGQTTEMGEKVANAYMTSPDDAQRFVAETGIDCLAVAIGNAHGLYPFEPKLDFERLAAIIAKLPENFPLVMHGGTGIPADQIKRSIEMGIRKVNYSTATRKAFLEAIRDFMAKEPDNLMMIDVFTPGSAAFQKVVCEAIDMVGSANRL